MAAGPVTLHFLARRFPPWRDVIAVLGLVVFAIHAWSILQFLFNLPSFALKFDTGEILSIFCYHMAVAALESLLVCGLLTALSALLPAGWLRSGFVHKAALLFLFAVACSIALQKMIEGGLLVVDPSRPYVAATAAVGALLLLGSLEASARVVPFRKLLLDVVDRFTVMLYVFLPLDAVGLIIVSWRLLR